MLSVPFLLQLSSLLPGEHLSLHQIIETHHVLHPTCMVLLSLRVLQYPYHQCHQPKYCHLRVVRYWGSPDRKLKRKGLAWVSFYLFIYLFSWPCQIQPTKLAVRNYKCNIDYSQFINISQLVPTRQKLITLKLDKIINKLTKCSLMSACRYASVHLCLTVLLIILE